MCIEHIHTLIHLQREEMANEYNEPTIYKDINPYMYSLWGSKTLCISIHL